MGLATHPNHLGLMCTLGAGLAVAAWPPRRRGVALPAVLVANIAGVVLSGSRVALVALGVVAVVGLVLPGRRGEQLAGTTKRVVAGAAIGAVLAVSHGVTLHRLQGDAESDAGRRFLREVSIDRISRSPWTGEGFRFLEEAHNVPLQLAAAGGPLTAAAFGGLLLTPLVVGLRRRDDPASRWFTAAWCGYLAIAVVQNIVVDRYLWFVAALIVVPRSDEAPDPSAQLPK
jgi:O-antigen ligase